MNHDYEDTMGGRMTMGGEEVSRKEWTGTLSGEATAGGSGGPMLAGRYKVVRRLGEGGMGSVWLSEDTKLDNRQVAIKMLPAVLANKKGAYRQVKQEALMAMKLAHPNIATVRAFEEDEGGAPFLVMDYIEGTGLDDILAEKGALGEAETLKLLGPVAAALDYAHGKGVVHRDVKPGNVIVDKNGTPFVLDFGIAREIQETMTRVTGKFSSGTLLYMSPEQLNGRAPKAAQDVYSFAAMAYECLAGMPPFSRGQVEWQIVNNPPEPLPEDAAGEALRQGIMAGLAKEPEKRPGTCAGVLARGGASTPYEPEKGTTAGRTAGKSAGDGTRDAAGKAAETTACPEGSPHQGSIGKGIEGGDVFLRKVRVGRALETARREDATAEEMAVLERVQEVYVAGKEALTAGEHAAAAGLFRQCELEVGKWLKEVDERKERDRATAVAQEVEARRKLEEQKAREQVEEAALKAAEQKRAEEEAARKREDAVWMAKVAGGLVLAVLLTWLVVWCAGSLKNKWQVARINRELRAKDTHKAGETKIIELKPGNATMVMVWCPAGAFMMRSPKSENGQFGKEERHLVTFTEGFWIAQTEVTQEQWKSVMGENNNPSEHKGDRLPVERVAYSDCWEFCQKSGLELPTEAEWEYACRAGSTGAYGRKEDLETMGWYSENSGNETHPVGQKQPNAWGVYDMHGNVWEWCTDYFAGDPSSTLTKPANVLFRGSRVLRGGCYRNDPQSYRTSSYHAVRDRELGFRPMAREERGGSKVPNGPQPNPTGIPRGKIGWRK